MKRTMLPIGTERAVAIYRLKKKINNGPHILWPVIAHLPTTQVFTKHFEAATIYHWLATILMVWCVFEVATVTTG